MKIETKYSIGDRVKIVDLEYCNAIINQICIGQIGFTYEIYWFHDGERRSGWLTEHELSDGERPPKERAGPR